MFKAISAAGLAAAIALAGVASAVLWSLTPSAKAQARTVLRVDLNDVIHPVSADFVKESLERAAAIDAEAVLIRMDTPGGLEESMRTIVESILASRVPVIIWVGPGGARAASAGFFILLAADAALMAPGTNTGAAHPVSVVGGQIEEVMEKKIVSDAAAFLRSYTSKRGRNAELAETAVTESRSFTDQEALQNNLIDGVAADIPDVFRTLDGKELRRFDGVSRTMSLSDPAIEVSEMTARQKILSTILNPNIALLLAALGVLGIYLEVTHPGLILPGVAGGISLILALFAFNLLPVSMTGVLLLLLAIVLFILEATVTSHGILAVGGIVSMVGGGLMLVEGPIPELRIQLSTVLAIAIPFAAITVFLLRLVLVSQRNTAATGNSWFLGKTALTRTPVHKTGKVLIYGEIWNAWSRNPIPEGSSVRIIGVDGLNLEIEAESEGKQ